LPQGLIALCPWT